MGNRALVVFKKLYTEHVTEPMLYYSPAVYVHWHGGQIREWLEEAAPQLRKGDPGYAAARFCGFCHQKIPGLLSLGLFNGPSPGKEDWPEYSHGDEGVFLVDVDSGEVTDPEHSPDHRYHRQAFVIKLKEER